MSSLSNEQRGDLSSQMSDSSADGKLSRSSHGQPEVTPESQQMAQARANKAEAIRKACDSCDIDALVSYATTDGGLLEDGLRQRACQ